jgi:hypothetical protein
VEEKLYQPSIVYGQIALKKNLDLEIEELKIPRKKIMVLHLIQRREQNFERNSRQTFKSEKSSSNPGYQRRDVSEIQCFRCDSYGHYARNCPSKKKGRQYASTADIDPDPPQKNEEKREEKYFL